MTFAMRLSSVFAATVDHRLVEANATLPPKVMFLARTQARAKQAAVVPGYKCVSDNTCFV